MKHIKMKYGFTLIELLVVVIIIAVLSAVALPMYKHAALKSRFSKVMPVAKSIVEAQEVYYLGKNIYAANDEKDLLDVSPSGATTIELATRDQENQYNYVAASSSEVPGARYIMYQKHSPRFANTIQCEADTADEQALWLCEKGLNGQEIPGGSINTTQGKTYKTFLLDGDRGDDTFIPPCPEGATCDDNGQITECSFGYYVSNNSCKACTGTQLDDIEPSSLNPSSATATCVNGEWKYTWTHKEFTAANTCESSQAYGCAGLIYGVNQNCKGKVANACADAIFDGKETVYTKPYCGGKAADACMGASFTGKGYCDGQVENACNGAIIQTGGYCYAENTGGCNGALYGALPGKDPSLIGSCYGTSCPTGVPLKGDWNANTHSFNISGWKGNCCNPKYMVSGVCPDGIAKCQS